jgi:hypothetical protein
MPIEAELPIGKDGTSKDAAVLEDLADLEYLIRVQMEYSVHEGSIQEKKVVKGFYRAEDKASAEEIVNESEPGKQYDKDEKYFDSVTYKDGLDEAAIEKWIAAGRPKGTGGGASKGTSEKAEKPSFGTKRKFGSKG